MGDAEAGHPSQEEEGRDGASTDSSSCLGAGNAGSNTTADHIEVLTGAIAQVPGAHRRILLIRSDGAGACHGLPDWLAEQDQHRLTSPSRAITDAVMKDRAR